MTQTEQRCGACIRRNASGICRTICGLPIRQREDGGWEHVYLNHCGRCGTELPPVATGVCPSCGEAFAVVVPYAVKAVGHAPVPQQESVDE